MKDTDVLLAAILFELWNYHIFSVVFAGLYFGSQAALLWLRYRGLA